MKTIHLILAMLVVASSSAQTKKSKKMEEAPIYEVAVRIVKDGKKEEFVEARSNFVTLLKAQEGVSNDREFKSFYALPEPDKSEVFIGMTQYDDADVLKEVQGEVYEKFEPFAQTMDLKAYVFIQQTEGPTLKLGELAAGEGEVLEIGVRRVKEGMEKEFDNYRKQFVKKLGSYDGVKESYEFAVIDGQNTERLTVGMTVYESQEAFMKLSEPLMKEEVTQKYFGTFDIVASQFATSTTNQ